MRLKDRVAIITGGARGIGRAYAFHLSEEGAKVVMADIIDATEAKQTIEEKGGEVMALYTDVSSEESTKETEGQSQYEAGNHRYSQDGEP